MDIPRHRTCCCPLSVSIDSLGSSYDVLDYLYSVQLENDPVMATTFSSVDDTEGSEMDTTPDSLSDAEICPHSHSNNSSPDFFGCYLGDVQMPNSKLDHMFHWQDTLTIFPELSQRFEDDIMDVALDLDPTGQLDFISDNKIAEKVTVSPFPPSSLPCNFADVKRERYDHLDEVIPSPTKSDEDVFCYDNRRQRHARNSKQCKKKRDKRRRRLQSEDSDTDESVEGDSYSVQAKREKRSHSTKSRLSISVDSSSIPKSKAPRPIHLYQFLIDLLRNEEYCPRYINWVSRDEGIFRLVDSAAVAQLWGQCKNRENMTYEKMSRALRYYYENGILERVPNCRLQYRFGKVVYEEYGDLL